MNDAQFILNSITDKVREYGRAVVSVMAGEDGSAPFSYTIGNAARVPPVPELFVLGMIGDHAVWLLNAISEKLADGAPMGALDLGGPCPVHVLIANEEAKGIFAIQATRWLKRDDYELVQVVVPDPAGRFPWDADCAMPYCQQKIFRRLVS